MRTTATTRYGQVEGVESNGIAAFKGIPFAAPPVGARRFAPPERPAAWSGVRPAKAFGPVAPQTRIPIEFLKILVIDDPQSEDCLTLNVWTPGVDGERRPVLVWIHGGGFTIGAGSQPIYDGEALARRGNAVVVTVNYRLGFLGFLNLAEVTGGRIPASGNEGLLDQIAALEWVRENIAAFGGDPGCVTIFGESAGGMSVGALLGLSQAGGLFQRAIPQSGASSTAGTLERAVRLAERVAREVGVRATDADAWRAVPVERLLAAAQAINGPPGSPSEFGMIAQPTIDDTVMTRRPIDAVRAGSAAGVAVLAGSTQEEWKLFLAADPTSMTLSEAALGDRVRANLRGHAEPAAIVDIYRRGRSARGEGVSPPETLAAIETDRVFRVPALRLLEAQSRHDPRTYAYLFNWRSPMAGGMFGACHGLEIGFAFGTHGAPGMPEFCGAGPAADALAATMMDAWLAFARGGDPSSAGVGRWRAYDARERATMLLGEKCAIEPAPFETERRAWEGLPDTVVGSL